MTKATKVSFDENSFCSTNRIFWAETSKFEPIYIDSFSNGIVSIESFSGCSIRTFAEIVAGFFHEESNFKEGILKVFHCPANTPLIGVRFEFNGVKLFVTEKNADPDKIYAEWYAGAKALADAIRPKKDIT